MSRIQECLSVFAVSAMVNNATSIERAECAIDAYLEGRDEESSLPALRELQDAYQHMNLDSTVANEIREQIVARIVRLAGQ